MSHSTITVTLPTHDPALVDNLAAVVKAALAPISDHHTISTEITAPKFRARIDRDHDPMNPRDWDNIDVMFCKHSRYALGDESAGDPFVEEEFCQLPDVVAEALEELAPGRWPSPRAPFPESEYTEARGALLGAGKHEAVEELEAVDWEWRNVLSPDVHPDLILPIYLYDHGGITVSHGSFSCPWDSGQVGWHYMTRIALKEHFDGDVDKALACLKAELKTYDHYIQGEVWGFEIEDEEEELVDSCSGFYGDDLEGIVYHAGEQHRALLEAAWEERFEGKWVSL